MYRDGMGDSQAPEYVAQIKLPIDAVARERLTAKLDQRRDTSLLNTIRI